MDDQLDIFGQQPFFTINTQICFCFPSRGSSDTDILKTLANGLDRLYTSFPWLACEVVNEGSGEENTGIYKFKPLPEAPRIVVKDLTHDNSMPTMELLQHDNFPMRMLDENIIAPRKTFVEKSNSGPAPVFLVQANIITGGLILTFVAQHNTMDMTGQAHIIYLFSKACRGEAFTEEELLSGNLPRHNIVPLLENSWTPGPEVHRHVLKAIPSHHISESISNAPLPCTWAYFTFPASSIASLKSIASEVVSTPAYVSSDDVLTAFIWRAVTRARLPRLDPLTQSTIARAVDVRPYLNISPTYPGPIQISTYNTSVLHSLLDEPLGNIALRLRLAIDPETSDLEFYSRAIATYLSRIANKAMFSATAGFDTSVDLVLSSWAKLKGYGLDFNLGLGMPLAVRRPLFQPVQGLAFLMPKTLHGDIEAAICLRDEDMERLREDVEFGKYGTYIG